MIQKVVSFDVAKAIKDCGYPQGNTQGRYAKMTYYDNEIEHNIEEGTYTENFIIHSIDAPTYFDVLLWLWREKRWFINIQPIKDKFHYQILDRHYDEWHSWGIYSKTGYQDPEEAIIVAVDYLVDNNLIKNYVVNDKFKNL